MRFRGEGFSRFNVSKVRVVLMTRIILAFWPIASFAEVEVRRVLVEIRSPEDELMKDVRVKCRGHSETSAPSSPTGLTELPLPPGVAAGDLIRIELEVGSAVAQDWTFLQPFDGNFYVPGKTQRYYEIRLVRRTHLTAMLTRAKSGESDIAERKVSKVRKMSIEQNVNSQSFKGFSK